MPSTFFFIVGLCYRSWSTWKRRLGLPNSFVGSSDLIVGHRAIELLVRLAQTKAAYQQRRNILYWIDEEGTLLTTEIKNHSE